MVLKIIWGEIPHIRLHRHTKTSQQLKIGLEGTQHSSLIAILIRSSTNLSCWCYQR